MEYRRSQWQQNFKKEWEFRSKASNDPIGCLLIGGTIVLLQLAIAAVLWIVVQRWAATAL
jgi:hypothetical protein